MHIAEGFLPVGHCVAWGGCVGSVCCAWGAGGVD